MEAAAPLAEQEGGLAVTYEIEIGGRAATVSVEADSDGGFRVSVDGGPKRRVRAGQLGAAAWWLEEAGARRTLAVHVAGDVLAAQVAGHGLVGTVVDPRDRALAELGGASDGAIRTPMPGAVARVLVAVGDLVEAGQILVVVEAMKMENEFKAPLSGRVVEIAVTAGTAVEANALLVVVEGGAG
jgi:acetyl-CoA/propionyl-CoA carboxylase, biotin carboxylase, biotin carboxyl carrier protein